MHYTTPEVYEFISKKTSDPIVERKTCRVSGTKFPIFQSDLEFYKKISPKFGDKTFDIPTPTLCPEERQRRRLMFRNERKLYKRKCDASGKDIISLYSPDKDIKVYNYDYWWSDNRDPLEYGREFNFNESFSDQFLKLSKSVPILPLFATANENSSYVNGAEKNKDCYLIFVSDHNEKCFYSDGLVYSDNSMDCLSGYQLSHCFDMIGCKKCFNSRALLYCESVNNSMYCSYSSALDHCLLCRNIQNMSYCILNKQYTKEVYMQKRDEILNSGKSEVAMLFQKVLKNSIKPTTNTKENQDVFGNNVYESKDGIFLFDCFQSEKGKYGSYMNKNSYCQDGYVLADNCQLCYENVSSISNYQCGFTYSCWHNNKEIFYCQYCSNCQNCFGCIGLRNKQYCIFNKQYTKEQYNELVPKIIGHMMETGERGEFFDPSLSPFGYNETVAQEYFPLRRDDALVRPGYQRQDNNYDPKIPDGVPTLTGDQIPSDITTVTDDILKKILICEVSGRPFRIIRQELDFYRKHNLPLPRKHPDVRHEERLAQRPPRELHLRHCDKCGVEMVSVYRNIEKSKDGTPQECGGNIETSKDGTPQECGGNIEISKDGNISSDSFGTPSHSSKIYCEKCYQTEIYG